MVGWLQKILDSHNTQKSDVVVTVLYEDHKNSIEIGTLKKENGSYVFEYNNNCPKHLRIKGMEEDKMNFKYLPPFFTTRIPSRSRPELKEIFERTGNDPLKILGEMASRSPVSPYIFEIRE